MPNALTRDIGFRVGPVLLEVLAKHYFEGRKADGEEEQVKLRKDEVLFDEAFNLVKSFLNTASLHTVEDLQAFSNTRTPSPPWVKVVRTLVPMTSCDQAATYIIQVLGGEEFCRQLVGGVKWWQVRGVNGVDGQWIVAKKDWREARRRHKHQRQAGDPKPQKESTPEAHRTEEEEAAYNKDMDSMRCILFLHGGGYYFGSVDQERYGIQRLARKINGRVFAINYRLAPQYPFPCALQDALAAYLYLIRPPPESPHAPVSPGHIVIAGDSAGGGLSLSLLQVIRDTGLPPPAGAIAISPWCDLTHSFPSIHLNTKTDVIPDCGLSFHKPSTLWPPPSEEVSTRVHASLRHRIRQAFKMDDSAPYEPTETVIPEHLAGSSPNLHSDIPVDVGSTTSLPEVDPKHLLSNQTISLTTDTNETLELRRQIHFYTENSLIVHPLISSSLSYLGGLPPIFFIIGDKEVLRDEGIYTAHKAANPSQFPIPERSKQLYPPLRDLKPEDMKPTSVHLQVYDDAPHVLPILFSFTSPAKFCFRSMANFCKFVTNTPTTPPLTSHGSFSNNSAETNRKGSTEEGLASTADSGVTRSQSLSPNFATRKGSLTRRLSARMSRASSLLRRRSTSALPTHAENGVDESPSDGGQSLTPSRPGSSQGNDDHSFVEPSMIISPRAMSPELTTDTDVGGPRFNLKHLHIHDRGERFAGEALTYAHIKDSKDWECGMMRERVAIDGVIRPLEPEDALDALKMPEDIVGALSERTMRRCLVFQEKFDKKFENTYISVEKHRRKNLERSRQDTIKQISQLRRTILTKDTTPNSTGRKDSGSSDPETKEPMPGFKELLLSSPGWSWAWALDEHENPPPSSIVSRRDTSEARKLAEVADLALLGKDSTFSGNNLWSIVVNFLTVTPGKPRVEKSQSEPSDFKSPGTEKRRFKLPRMFSTDGQATTSPAEENQVVVTPPVMSNEPQTHKTI